MNLRIKCNKKTLREEKQELKARLNETEKRKRVKGREDGKTERKRKLRRSLVPAWMKKAGCIFLTHRDKFNKSI
jgi:hypothetical protein